MICSNCGSENNGDNRFCYVCGAPLLENQYPYGTVPVSMPPKKNSNGLGIAALVVGILALTLSWIIIPGWILGVIAIMLGIIQCVAHKSKGLGIAGIILGILGIIAATAMFIWALGLEEEPVKESGNFEVNRRAEDTGDKQKNDKSKDVEGTLQRMQTEYGSFDLVADWSKDPVNSDDECFIYAPDTAGSYENSDYMYMTAFETNYGFEDKDMLIRLNKDDILKNYEDSITEDEIVVYIQENLEIPIIGYNFTVYDEYVEEDVEVWEYHLVYEGALVIFSSFDYDSWENSDTMPEDVAYQAATSFKLNN